MFHFFVHSYFLSDLPTCVLLCREGLAFRRQGACPAASTDDPVLFADNLRTSFQCSSDDGCPDRLKCCSQEWGRRCLIPTGLCILSSIPVNIVTDVLALANVAVVAPDL